MNNLNQLQNLLFQISTHISKINEIITMMNNIINQMNNPMINQLNNLMNNHVYQMNNLMNMGNEINFNCNLNNCFNQNNNIINPNDIYNFHFRHCDGSKLIIVIDSNKTIKELINSYFLKIGKYEYINNYEKEYYFEINNELLNKYEEKKIKDILKNGNDILVKKKGEMSPF